MPIFCYAQFRRRPLSSILIKKVWANIKQRILILVILKFEERRGLSLAQICIFKFSEGNNVSHIFESHKIKFSSYSGSFSFYPYDNFVAQFILLVHRPSSLKWKNSMFGERKTVHLYYCFTNTEFLSTWHQFCNIKINSL